MGKKPSGNNFKSFESITANARHYRITVNMVDSKAWKDLDIYARDLYHYMKAKFNFTNENNISCTYTEGTTLMCKANFNKAIDSLILHGFIKIIENGRTQRKPNIYGFSDLWQRYPDINIIPRKKRNKEETEKSYRPKGKKEILARSKLAQCTRSNITQCDSNTGINS